MTAPHPAFAACLALVAASRIIELGVSRQRVRGLDVDEATRDPNYLWMISAHVALFVAPVVELALTERPFSWTLAGPMLGLLAVATALRLWVIRCLGPSWNTRGLIDPGMTVVTSGPYSFIRHPNYLAVGLEFIALPLVQGCWMSALGLSLFNAAVLVGRIRAEESQLGEIAAWREAFADKKRIVPGLF